MIDELKPYPDYKSTSSIWLKNIPAHWDAMPMGRVLVERKEKNDPIRTRDILSLGLATGVIPYSDKKTGGNKRKDDLSQYMLAYPGDIVVNSMNVIVGSVGLSRYFGAVSPVYYMLRPRQNSDLVHFFDAIFQDRTFQKSLYGLGNGIMVIQSKSSGKLNTIRMRIPMSRLRQVQMPYPPPEEQAAIVKFLDYANGKIERAIRAKRKLIGLLNEQKQAIIHRAVTRGLDPNVKLKPSGIPWLGDIPQHWDEVRLKFLVKKVTDGEHISPPLADSGVPMLSAKDIRDRTILYEVNKFVIPEHAERFWRRCRPQPGDFLVVSRGATIGRVALVEHDIPFCLMGSVILCKTKESYTCEFLYYALNAFHAQTSLWFTSASSAQQAIYIRDVAELRLPTPPKMERDAISRYLDQELSVIQNAAERTRREIELLREYRTTLTAEVVTGKLDVREAAERLPDHAVEPLPSDESLDDLVDDEITEEVEA
jgi:type I restriction enzyme S subunit